MEEDLKEVVSTKDRILTENNESNTVATIYCSCNGSKLFVAGRSSVQTQLANQCSFNFSGLAQPNFCELDIITKNEKVNTVIKFFPLETTAAKLKSLPMINKIPQGNTTFRRTASLDKKMNEKSSEVLLHMEKVLKNCDSLSDGALGNLNKSSKVEKHGRHKPRRSAEHKRKPIAVKSDNSTHCTSFIDNKEIIQKYNNLVNAKTMYFVNLPNKIDKKKRKKSQATKEAIQKNTNENESKDCNSKSIIINKIENVSKDCNSKSIIINKIENDISQWNSVNSQSTLCAAKGRTASEISLDCSLYSNRKSKSSTRIHNNSPTSDVTIQEIMVKPDKHGRKRKQKKRHENSKQTSTDGGETKKETVDFNKAKQKQTTKHSQKPERLSNVIHIQNVSKQIVQEEGRREEEELQVGEGKRKRKTIKRKPSKKRGYSKETNPENKSLEAENEHRRNILKDNVAEENNKSRDNEIKVIYKDKNQEFGARKHLRKRSTSQTKNTKLESASIINGNDNKRREEKENNTTKKNDDKERTQNAENDKPKANSVLKLYFVDKLAPSTSSLKLTDDLLLKLKGAKRKQAASWGARSKRRTCASPTTDNQIENQKRRSKSRVTKEEATTQHRSKPIVEQQKSRKSASDVSKKRCVENFDITASVERKFESPVKHKLNNTEEIKVDKPFRAQTKKSKASLSTSTTTFKNNWPKDSYWTEGISTVMETIRKENRKWLKSCTRKEYEFVCQYSEETKSDTSVNRINPERSKSLATKVRTRSVLATQTSLTQSSPKNKFYEELCKLGTHQNIQSNNRFRVTSKPIRNKDSSTTNNEGPASDVRSCKLKPRPSSEKEKEAILNLFKPSNSPTKNPTQNSSEVRKNRRNRIKTKTKCSSTSSKEEALKSLDENNPKRRKRIRKRLFRREVSFTHLNVTPVQELYRKRSRTLVTKATSLSPEILFSKKIEKLNLALGKGFACKTLKTQDTAHLQPPVLFKRNVEEKKMCTRKLSFFHMASGEKILEISTRAIANDGNITVGFTVSGTEPPKRLKNNGVAERTVPGKSSKLHMTFLPPIEINESSGFENAMLVTKNKNEDGESTPQDIKLNKDDIIKVVKEMPLSFVPSAHLKRKKASSFITYRRISKVRSRRKNNFRTSWKKRIPEVARATKVNEKRPNGFEKREEVQNEGDVKCCFNKLKLCRFRQTKEKVQRKNKPGLILPKSTLLTITEESHSTDSSRCRNRTRDKPSVSTDFKITQTDFESNDDIIKMKEVINYLYSAIEQNKNSKTEIKTSDKYFQAEKRLDSSTETSSYDETKKNRFKRIITLANQKASNSGSLQNNRATKTKLGKSSPVTTGSSSYENTSSTSKNRKSSSTERSSSGDVLSSSYFQKYKATKALIDSKKKAKVEPEPDKAVKTTLGKFESAKVDKNIGTTNDLNVLVDQEQNTSENFVKDPLKDVDNPTLKKFEDKSLQTTNHINPIVQVESNPQGNEIYDCLYADNSTNSDNNAIVEKSPKEKTKKKKPPSTLERLKRVFGAKEQKYIKNETMAYNMSEKVDSDVKMVSGRQSPIEMDYVNFIKFERHLEQVLGLYPSIFKAIRAQMDVTFGKNREIKTSDLFQSKSTLATTVDTVTEYKNTECYEKSSNSVNNDRLEHCCNCYHVWHKKYVVQRYMNSQDFGLRSRKHAESIRQQKAYRRKIEENRANKYDSASSMKPNVSRRSKKNRRQTRKQNFDETCGLHSLTSVYSNDRGFLSSCSSISLDEKWSIASPLYGRTTSLEDLSAAQQNVKAKNKASTSSQSLTVNKITLPSEGRKSKSLIEVSTKKSVNRQLTLKQLINASVHQNNLMQTLEPNILLMSVSSSCTVFTTPSRFLAKVEKHLQIAPPEMASKAVGEGLVTESVLPKCRPKVDEKLYQKILFPNTAKHLKINAIPRANRQKPFYIHKPVEDNSEQEPDSLEVTSPRPAKIENEEEDFSADSLEIIKCPPKSCKYNMLYTSTTYVKPANQTYFVYSNTIQNDKKLSKHTDRDKRNSSKHRKADDAEKKRSVGVSHQNVSNTLISESGYESTKSKRTASIRNFFKKGGSLLDMFRSSTKTTTTKTQKIIENQNVGNFTNFSNLGTKKEETQNVPKKDVGTSLTKDKSSGIEKDKNKMYWHSVDKDKKVGKQEKKATNSKMGQQSDAKSPEIRLFPTSPLSFALKSYKKQKDECHAYAEKVVLESQLRKEGYYKQYRDFKEMPLELLIGKKIPCKSKPKNQQTNFVQASPKSTPTSIQTEIKPGKRDLETDRKSAPKTFVGEEKITLRSDVTETKQPINTDQLKQDVTPSLSLKNQSRKEVGKPLAIGEASSSGVIVAKSKAILENIVESNLSTNSLQDPIMSSTKISEDLNLKASEDGFHELYVNSTELTQLTKSESKIADDLKPKISEDSFDLCSGVTQSEAEATQFRLKSRSKTPEDTKSRSKSLSDRKHQNIAETSEVQSKSRLKLSEQSKSDRSRELYGSYSGHQKSVVNILETAETNLKSRKRSSQEDLESGNIPEQRKSTVAIAKVNQFRSKSRSSSADDSKSKSSKGSSKSKSKSEVASKSTSTKRQKDIEHNCHCKEETPDPNKKRHLKKVVDEEVESDTLHSIPVVPSNEEVTRKAREEVEDDPDTVQSGPVVSSIIDIIFSNSVTEDIVAEDVSEPRIDESQKSAKKPPRNVTDDFRKGLTDKEVFEKLLESYEKKDTIAARLSKDDDFFNSQIDSLKRQSDESFAEQRRLSGKGSKIYKDDSRKSTHFWEERIRQMRTKEDNPVKADDLGICFARGFRPDNMALSGDACFNLNKQDRLIFSEKMLSDQESIIDFSERETPLDYLLALGFMVDEASNALKDEDIRSRLLAAITEARVWVNKITTTQGTLLYLVAYKSRPKTMRYFLQLVEAIINKRINNAIKLDGFLRILEQVEEGEIQMINILGAEKFEDEESEEKIVRKQLKQLFITVYKIAEHESFERGQPLSQDSILLLRILAAKYRAGLHPHLELIARYIGQELLTTETQLEAAMIFLSRLDTAEVKLKEFEAYCDIRCEKRKKPEERHEPADGQAGGSAEKTEESKNTEKTNATEKTKSNK